MKQQIIVLCGPDRCGKTEIAKELSSRLGIPSFKASSEHETYLKQPNQFVYQLRYADVRMVDFLAQTGYSVIMDRAWPCERAYSQVMNRQTDPTALIRIDNAMAKLGARVVICYRS